MPKTLFITGASTGIGAATARAAVGAGWNVGLMARSRDKLEALCSELGEQAMALPGDVTDLKTQQEAVDQLATSFGTLDAAFANAGAGLQTPGTEGGIPTSGGASSTSTYSACSSPRALVYRTSGKARATSC